MISTICGGETKSWNYKSGMVTWILKKKILDILMLVPWNNIPVYKEHAINFIVFDFIWRHNNLLLG